MLIDFTVGNFRCFGEKQTLSLISAEKVTDHPDHHMPIGKTGKNVLRCGVIYGANAAGKSNLVRAVTYATGMITGTTNLKALALHQFRFQTGLPDTFFEFRFLVEQQIFVYGFTANSEAITEEWLEATIGNGENEAVFHRTGQKIAISSRNKFGIESDASHKALGALKILGPRPNQLLLNKIVDLDEQNRGQLFNRVSWWFKQSLVIVQPESSFAPLLDLLHADEHFREFAGRFLHNIGTGIDSLQVALSRIKADDLPKDLVKELEAPPGTATTLLVGSANISLELDPKDPRTVIRGNLNAIHGKGSHGKGKKVYPIPFQDESDGTQRCLHLLPALYQMKTGRKVYLIDELNRSLHPLLSYEFVKFFIQSSHNAYQQLILTTHETHLLNLDLLRLDEIWFVEKDRKQQSHLYSLANTKLREDMRNIEKGYIQGRFGGIPFIGSDQKLLDLLHNQDNLRAS